jgi:heat shock protein HslJ
MRRFSLILAAALGAAGCAGWSGGASADIRGVEWEAVDIGGRAALGDRPPTLRLQRGRDLAGGESGCNIWSAGYAVGRGTIRLRDLTSTRRACTAPALAAQESLYLSLLQEADRFTVWADGTLTLAGPAGRTITFRRAAPAAD